MRQVPTFLVSGGARGITARCVIRLAQAADSRWILLGRSTLMPNEPDWARDCQTETDFKRRIFEDLLKRDERPVPAKVNSIYQKISASREIKATLQAIEATGSKATYLSADVTNGVELKEKLTPAIEALGPISGIIHGAGSLADKRIEQKTEQDFERVYAPKVVGLKNLLNCVAIDRLNYLVLFSSVAGFYGNVGQADYALANEILNKAALRVQQMQPHCQAISINWGPWEGGMVTPALKAAFEQRGVTILPVDKAAQMLANELDRGDRKTAQVVVGSPIPSSRAAVGSALKTHQLYRQLRLEDNPFLADHVIAGSPILPFTCFMAWVGRSGERLYPGFKATDCENARLLKGIDFSQPMADKYLLTLVEISKCENEIVVESKISSQLNGKTRYHFSCRTTLRRQYSSRPTLASINLAADETIPATPGELYDVSNYSLFHGPSFQGIQRVLNVNGNRISAQCLANRAANARQGQFPASTVDPYTLDIQLHPVLVWLRHFHQATCLPASVRRYETFAPVPYAKPFYVTAEIVDKTNTRLSANITAYSEQGELYSRIEGAESTILPPNIRVA